MSWPVPPPPMRPPMAHKHGLFTNESNCNECAYAHYFARNSDGRLQASLVDEQIRTEIAQAEQRRWPGSGRVF